jgi:hypothetical protein
VKGRGKWWIIFQAPAKVIFFFGNLVHAVEWSLSCYESPSLNAELHYKPWELKAEAFRGQRRDAAATRGMQNTLCIPRLRRYSKFIMHRIRCLPHHSIFAEVNLLGVDDVRASQRAKHSLVKLILQGWKSS